MSAIFSALSELFAPFLITRAVPRVRIEEWSFRLHFRVTTVLLFLFSALLCMRQYIGEHIKCQSYHDDDANDPVIPRKVIETYCFIQTTFTVPLDPTSTTFARNRLHTNVGGPQYVPGRTTRIHHAYYQWMPFYLFFLGIFFLLTHRIWKSIENGKIRGLVYEINTRDLLSLGDSKRTDKVASVARYIVDTKGTHGFWAFSYVMTEFANLFVILSSMYVTDRFLGHEFTLYGPRVIEFLEADPETRTDPMASVFPRITKCLFHTFGYSGSIQRLDAICVLPSNILNEKIFTFLWFWFVFLALVTIGALLYRLLSLLSKKVRIYSLVGTGLSSNFPFNSQSVAILRKLSLSDWFLLRFLQMNLDEETFSALIRNMYEEVF